MDSSLPDPLPGLTYMDSVGRCQLPGVGGECSWSLDDAPHCHRHPGFARVAAEGDAEAVCRAGRELLSSWALAGPCQRGR